jgi:hypothetical protein
MRYFIMEKVERRDQLCKLLEFLRPTLGIIEQEQIIELYQNTWLKLAAHFGLQGTWSRSRDVEHAYSGDTVQFWQSLHSAMGTQFSIAMNESSKALGHSEKLDDYNELLKIRLDRCLGTILSYIKLRKDHDKITKNQDDYTDDDRAVSAMVIANTSQARTESFMDLIVFMYVVPRRPPNKWDSLEADDKYWYDFQIHPCRYYQQQQELMSFLSDCAVVIFPTGNFEYNDKIRGIRAKYLLKKTSPST